MMLLYRLWSRLEELEHKPPVTLALIVVNMLIHAARHPATAPFVRMLSPEGKRFYNLVQPYLAVRTNCINPDAVLANGEVRRLWLSTLIHLDDVHLLYNMLSLVHKGVTLETKMGSQVFTGLVVYLAFASNLLYVAVAVLLKEAGVYSRLVGSCAAGFSGVLFGLGAVLTTSGSYRSAAYNIFVSWRSQRENEYLSRSIAFECTLSSLESPR